MTFKQKRATRKKDVKLSLSEETINGLQKLALMKNTSKSEIVEDLVLLVIKEMEI